MGNNEKYKYSDEISRTITNKWVFSISPVIEPADISRPYSCMGDKTAMQLRLSENGGERVVFNLTWAQFDALKHAVDKAQENSTMEKSRQMKAYNWDLKDACGDDDLVRIFGEPDKNGLCPVRKLVLKRQPEMRSKDNPNETVLATAAWYIEISSGRGKKLLNRTGGYYMQGGSYREEKKCYCRISDGRMKNHVYWGEFFMNVMNMAVKDAVLRGHKRVMDQKEEFKNFHN